MYADYLTVSGGVDKKVEPVYVYCQNFNFRVIISFIINLYTMYQWSFNRIHFDLFRKFDDGLL